MTSEQDAAKLVNVWGGQIADVGEWSVTCIRGEPNEQQNMRLYIDSIGCMS